MHEPAHRNGGGAAAAGLAVNVHSVPLRPLVLDERARRVHCLDRRLQVIDGLEPQYRYAALTVARGPRVLIAEIDDRLAVEGGQHLLLRPEERRLP